MKSYDYIIVGAGSAGCVLANRLSTNPANSVLLLEAGGNDWNPLIRVPLMAGVLYWMKSLNWGYRSEEEPNLEARRMPWPRGKVVGGTSTINGMMYARGLRQDYDGWGVDGWSYEEVLPYFIRSEAHAQRQDSHHGADGPMAVTTAEADNPLYRAFLEAGRLAGYGITDDFNGAEPEGFGRADFNIRSGRRESAATAFLNPARRRPNLRIETGAQVSHVIIQEGRAVSVEINQGGRVIKIAARGEVLLCGGTVNSPKLLMTSGIGPGAHLQAHGIPLIVDIPGVGQNLQDHLGAFVQHECLEPITLYGLFRPDRAAVALLRALLWGTGPAASMPLQAGACIRSNVSLSLADLKCSIIPGLTLEASRRGQGRHGFLVNTYALRPRSRGTISLYSSDPLAPPLIEPNYLSDVNDLIALREGLKLVRGIIAQSSFDRYRGHEIAPGSGVITDDEIDAWLRANARTVFHPVGTCRMGMDGSAVVDASLRVHGIAGLRVVDASIMPNITSGNTNAPTVMIAEKAADMILGLPPLPPVAHLKAAKVKRR